MNTVYIINYKQEKPVGVFDTFNGLTEFISNQISPRNLPDPSPFIVFSVSLNNSSWYATFVSPDQYWKGDLVYRISLSKEGKWTSFCQGFPYGFNSASNEVLKSFYRRDCSNNSNLYSEDVLATSSEAALVRVQDKLNNILLLLNKKIE